MKEALYVIMTVSLGFIVPTKTAKLLTVMLLTTPCEVVMEVLAKSSACITGT